MEVIIRDSLSTLADLFIDVEFRRHLDEINTINCEIIYNDIFYSVLDRVSGILVVIVILLVVIIALQTLFIHKQK